MNKKSFAGLCSVAVRSHCSGTNTQRLSQQTHQADRAFPAGGGGDTLARLVMTRAAKELGQNVVDENLGGAGGNVGSAAAAKAPADGYTLLYGIKNMLAINHTIYKTPGFSPTKDFDPVTKLTSIAAMVVVRPGLAANSMAELTTLL